MPESQCFQCHPDLTFEKLPTLREGADLTVLVKNGETVDDFARTADKLRQLLADAGRDPAQIEIQVAVPAVDFDDAAAVGELDRFVSAVGAAGATRILAHVHASSASAAETYMTRFAEHFGL